MSHCSFAQASTDDASIACHPAQFLDIVKLLSRSAELARRTTLFHVKHHILLRAVCHPSAMPSTSVRTHMIGTDERPSSPKLTHTAGVATITYRHPCWCPAGVLMVAATLAAGPQLTSDDYSLEIMYHKRRGQHPTYRSVSPAGSPSFCLTDVDAPGLGHRARPTFMFNMR
ncbi:hypothetical protein HMPREF9344_00406 [Cutibacterium acnes HL097PA1]|nr:hypothetical protein HMPREF9344_00406 [Cutibacterium acnes HL097PA1]